MLPDNAHLGIVVGVDDSQAAKAAVEGGAREAELRSIPLTLVHAISPNLTSGWNAPLPPGLAQWQQGHGRRLVDDAVKIVEKTCNHAGPTAIHTEVLPSAAVPTLIGLSKDAEMVVTGSYGDGSWSARLLGSVASALLRHAYCPVAIVHDREPLTPHHGQAPVLVGIDGSPAAELATAIAFDEASRRRVGLVALHAWSDTAVVELPDLDWSALKSQEETLLAERLAGWQECYPDVKVHRLVVC